MSSKMVGIAAKRQGAAHLHHGVAAAQGSRRATSALARRRAALEDVRWRGLPLQVAGIRAQLQKAVLHLLRGVGGHKRALALAAHDQIFGGQLVDGLAHVPWLTLKRAASSISLGISSPGATRQPAGFAGSGP
jgi:hypothetical protein